MVERADQIGGLAAVAGPNASLVEWWRCEHEHLGTDIRLATATCEVDDHTTVIQATGSASGARPYEVFDNAAVLDIAEVRRGNVELPDEGTVVVFDPIGGPIGVALAEELGERAVLISQDNIAGNELSRTGDLAPSNTRLAQAGVTIERRTLLRRARPGEVEVEDKYSGQRRTIACTALVDCGFRLPTEPIDGAVQVGDAVAPRTVHEAVLEARRAALAI